MKTLELVLAIIGGWMVACIVFAAIWTIVHQPVRRRGGLLDLTPPSDSRKNARGAA